MNYKTFLFENCEILKIGDKIVNFTNDGDGLNLPLIIGKTYTYNGCYNYNSGFCKLQEKEARFHGYDIHRFMLEKDYNNIIRKNKLKKINNVYNKR